MVYSLNEIAFSDEHKLNNGFAKRKEREYCFSYIIFSKFKSKNKIKRNMSIQDKEVSDFPVHMLETILICFPKDEHTPICHPISNGQL